MIWDVHPITELTVLPSYMMMVKNTGISRAFYIVKMARQLLTGERCGKPRQVTQGLDY